jgi:hypothetical protein
MWYRFAVAPTILYNPIVGGFYVDGDLIEYLKPGNIAYWKKTLNTRSTNIADQEKLNEFLNNYIFEFIDGKKTYIPKFKASSPLKNPIKGGFWVYDTVSNELGEIVSVPLEIPYGAPLSTSDWKRKLKTHSSYINSQEKLNDFLSYANFTNINGNKTFVSGKKMLKNPIVGGFFVGSKFIDFEEPLVRKHWHKLLQTETIQDQDDLNAFLAASKFEFNANNDKIYIKSYKSKRERLLRNLSINDTENIKIEHHYPIKILNPQYKKTTTFYLDFVFIKNDKIILVIEINGLQHYGFVSFGSKSSDYSAWQNGLQRDIIKINYCHDNNIPILLFHYLLSEKDFKTIIDNLNKNPHIYDKYIPQRVMDNSVTNTSLEFIKRQIYSHLYPVFNNVISFENDESRKRYIKDTLILISKLMGIYDDGIDKTDYIRAFDRDVDLTKNYNICLDIYNILYPDFPLDRDEKITYSDLSKMPTLYKEKPPIVKKPKETNLVSTEEFKDKDNVV